MPKEDKNNTLIIAEDELVEEMARFRIDKVKKLLVKRLKLEDELRKVQENIKEVCAGKEDREFYIDA